METLSTFLLQITSNVELWYFFVVHYDDVIMGAMASQITSLTIVDSTVYHGADQSKHQSSASLAFVWGIHRGPVNSPHKWPVTRKMFPFDDVIMYTEQAVGHTVDILAISDALMLMWRNNMCAKLCKTTIVVAAFLPGSCQLTTDNFSIECCISRFFNSGESFAQAWSVPSCTESIDGLVQDCSIPIANALEILQSCTKPSIFE